jgi:hypothetical protein
MKRRKERRRRGKDKRIEKWEKGGGLKVHTQERRQGEREKRKKKKPRARQLPLGHFRLTTCSSFRSPKIEQSPANYLNIF